MNTSRLWCFFCSRQFSIVMNDGGAGLLEQDARQRGVAELEHAGHQQLQAFFVFWKPFNTGSYYQPRLKDPFGPGWSPGTKGGPFVPHH
jgi:hypothetical protein